MVSGETFPWVARRYEPIIIEVILPVADGTGSQSVGTHRQGFAAYGNGIGIKTIGTLTVEGIKNGRNVEGAISHDDTIIVAQYECALRVDGIEVLAACLPRTVGEVETLSTTSHCLGDGAESTWGGNIHRTCQRGILMNAVVKDEITGTKGEFVLRVATCSGQEGTDGQQGKEFSHDSNAFSASVIRSKWKPSNVCCISALMRSLHKLPMLPSWV